MRVEAANNILSVAQDWVSCITVVLNASQIKFKCEIKYYIC